MQSNLSQSIRLKTRQPSPNKSKDLSISVVVHAQSQSMLVQMKHHNNNLQDQLVNQKSSNTRDELLEKLNLEKLRQQCQIFAQSVEAEQIKKEELQKLIISYQIKQSNITQFENDDFQKTNQIYKHLEQKFQQLKQSLNIQNSQIETSKQDLNLSRRERVIHSTVVKTMESDIKQKSKAYMKLIKKREISDAILKVYNQELTGLILLIQKEDIAFDKEQKAELYKAQQESETFIQTESSNENRSSVKPYPSERKSNLMLDSALILQSHREEDELVSLQEAFQKIFNQTSVTSVQQLISLHETIEEQNSDLYLDVINTTSQIEIKQKEIEDIDKMIQSHQIQINKHSPRKKLISQLELSSSQKCDKQLENYKHQLDEMKNNLITIAYEVEMPDLQELQNEVNDWNLNIFADQVVEKCRQIMMVCELIDVPTNKKTVKIQIKDPHGRRQTSEESESTAIQGLRAKNQDKHLDIQLDEMLQSLEKIKTSEIIYNKGDFHQLGQTELKKRDKKRKLSKKQTTLQK